MRGISIGLAVRVAGAGLLALGFAASAQAQAGFVEFYYNTGVNAHFYYSPSSVQSNGTLRAVAWTSGDLQQANNGTEHLVYHVQIDCSAQTIQSQWVERFDAQSGASIGTVDLTGQGGPQTYAPGTMAGYLAGRAC